MKSLWILCVALVAVALVAGTTFAGTRSVQVKKEVTKTVTPAPAIVVEKKVVKVPVAAVVVEKKVQKVGPCGLLPCPAAKSVTVQKDVNRTGRWHLLPWNRSVYRSTQVAR